MNYIYSFFHSHNYGDAYDTTPATVTETNEWIEKNGQTIVTTRKPIKLFEAFCTRKCKYCGYEARFMAHWDDQNLMPTYTFLNWI